MVSVDYTYQTGTRGLMTLDVNPLVNGARLLAPDFLPGLRAARRA